MQRSALRHFEQVLHTILDGTEDALLKRDDIAIESDPDALDCIQRATERDLAICRIESDFGRLQSVRTALQRIVEGTYGICFRCECEIAEKRLNAVPWTSYCLACQDSADGRRGDFPRMELASVASGSPRVPEPPRRGVHPPSRPASDNRRGKNAGRRSLTVGMSATDVAGRA
jgi:RNA polymerase-binding transcription factor